MQEEHRYKAVIFDLDGTLVDSLPGLQQAINCVLSDNGFPTLGLDEVKARVGHGVTELVRRALPVDHRSEETIAACTKAMREAYPHYWKDGTVPYDGVEELLAALQKRGVPRALVTNKMQDVTDELVHSLFGSYGIDPVIGSDSGYPLKPDPGGAEAAACSLGVHPQRCIFLGDAETDMETAKNAGMLAAGALWGFRDRRVLLESGADRLLTHPLELLDLLQEVNTAAQE